MNNEKTYQTISTTGTISLVLGITTVVFGIAAGVLMIVNGARLIKRKSEILI